MHASTMSIKSIYKFPKISMNGSLMLKSVVFYFFFLLLKWLWSKSDDLVTTYILELLNNV